MVTKKVNCNCRLFQCKGILCIHAIAVFLHRKIYPDKYLLKRWSKLVKRSHTKVPICYDNWSTKCEARRFDKMCNAFRKAADLATDTEFRCDKVMRWICALRDDLKKEDDAPCSNQTIDSVGISKENNHVLTPVAVRCKGQPPYKRKQSNVEKTIKKTVNRKMCKEKKTEASTSKGHIVKDWQVKDCEEVNMEQLLQKYLMCL